MVAITEENEDGQDLMPLLPITLVRTISACANLELDDRTIFVCSYPKSGTTWMQNVVFQICSNGRVPLDHISNFCPFFENDKTWEYPAGTSQALIAPQYRECHEKLGWRIFNTHLWWNMMPKSGNARYIYVVRNSRDVCCSFYHHLSHQRLQDGGYGGSLDQFVDDWCEGKIAFGDWPSHLNSWLKKDSINLIKASIDPRILVVSFEDMKDNLKDIVARVAAHIGVKIDNDRLKEILPLLSFSYMKENIDKFEPKSVQWIDRGDDFSFIRKGKKGDSKTLFNSKHESKFQELFRRKPIPECCKAFIEDDGPSKLMEDEEDENKGHLTFSKLKEFNGHNIENFPDFPIHPHRKAIFGSGIFAISSVSDLTPIDAILLAGNNAEESIDLTGHKIWTSARVMILFCLRADFREVFTGKTILELGSGCGFAGLAIALGTACAKMKLTDMETCTISLLKSNIEHNNLSPICSADYLKWSGQQNPIPEKERYDFVIASDCAYDTDVLPHLFLTARSYCNHCFVVVNVQNRLFCGGLEAANQLMKEVAFDAGFTSCVQHSLEGLLAESSHRSRFMYNQAKIVNKEIGMDGGDLDICITTFYVS